MDSHSRQGAGVWIVRRSGVPHFFKCFRRAGNGVWICVIPAEVVLPQGRVQIVPGTVLTKGTTFMGIDMVKLLEDQTKESDTRH